MAAITITFSIQKGGVGKTTSSASTAHILSEKGYKVLAVDMDSQFNMSSLLTRIEDPDEYGEKTVLEAIEDEDARPYIWEIKENLHILPANDLTATVDQVVMKKTNPSTVLSRTLDTVRDQYDFIIIDTAPSIALPTANAVCASDFVVIMFEPGKFAYKAVPRFMKVIEEANQVKGVNVQVAGILRTLTDPRRSDAEMYLNLIAKNNPGLCFDTIIRRNAATGRLSHLGFDNNPELSKALSQYKDFVKELLDRVAR